MWIVRFIRKDAKPDEEYFYHSQGEAEYHGFTMGVLLMCEIFHSPFFPHTE